MVVYYIKVRDMNPSAREALQARTIASPCSMCSGAILLYKIPRLVIGENANFKGDEDLLRSRGVEVIVVDDQECKELMKKFIEEKPEVCAYCYIALASH